MSMLCPQCQTFHEQRLHCPACGVRLLYRDSRERDGRKGWRQTPWGRILIGLVLAQGLFFGLRHLYTGVLMGIQAQGAVPESLGTFSGLVLLQALQLCALFLGGVLAGAGHRHGAAIGCMVGVWNGVISVFYGPTEFLSAVSLYGQPMIHAACGAVAGWFGSMIWKPLGDSAEQVASRLIRKKPLPKQRVHPFAGPVAWVRVSLGAVLAVAGTLSAHYLFRLALDTSGGRLSTATALQDKIVTWEIQALTVMLGGALAGANTTNGFKQGLFVGLFTSFGLISFSLTHNQATLELISLTFTSSFGLGLLGGWFGSQLLPPVIPRVRLNNDLGAASA
jgi:hypothetical protein